MGENTGNVDNATTPALELFVAEIVSSYVRNNHVTPAELAIVINTVYQSLAALGFFRAAEAAITCVTGSVARHMLEPRCGDPTASTGGSSRPRNEPEAVERA